MDFGDFMGPIGSIITGVMNNDAASSRQEDAQAFSAQQYATRYQTTVKDMEAAGLNPMLAYGQGAGSAPTSSAASSAGTPDIGAAFNQSRMASAQVANIAADTENKKAQADLIQAQANQANWSAYQSSTQGDLNKSFIAKTQSEINRIDKESRNLDTEQARLNAVITNLGEANKLMQKQGLTEVQRAAELKAMANKLASENTILLKDIDAMNATNGWGRLARELKPISDIGSDWVSPKAIWDRVFRKSDSDTTRSK